MLPHHNHIQPHSQLGAQMPMVNLEQPGSQAMVMQGFNNMPQWTIHQGIMHPLTSPTELPKPKSTQTILQPNTGNKDSLPSLSTLVVRKQKELEEALEEQSKLEILEKELKSARAKEQETNVTYRIKARALQSARVAKLDAEKRWNEAKAELSEKQTLLNKVRKNHNSKGKDAITSLMKELEDVTNLLSKDEGERQDVQCPICFEKPGTIYCCQICDNMVCGECEKKSLESCPVCRQNLSESPLVRNKCAERLLKL